MQSGDMLGIVRLDGQVPGLSGMLCPVLSAMSGDDATRLDPLIMWGTGSHLGHTAVIMRYCHLRYLLRMHYQMSGYLLCMHYEMSGTDLGYAATRDESGVSVLESQVVCPMVLRGSYAMSSTDEGDAACVMLRSYGVQH
eukprot:41979-Rhodomonas_salina.5